MTQAEENLNITIKEIMDIAMGFQKTQILYTATSLGIFEELTTSLKPLPASRVARKLGLDPDATERLLNTCSALCLLEKTYNSKKLALYRNTPTAEKHLATSGPGSIRPLITKVGDLYNLFGQLKAGVKEGRGQLDKALGNGEQCFEEGEGFYCSTQKQNEFLGCMHLYSNFDAPHVVRSFDFSLYKTAVDLGGGTGILGFHLAKEYPSMEVSVADLNHVIELSSSFLPKATPSNFHLQAKDFFKDDLQPADLYILSHVVHDWNDEKLKILLQKVYRAINQGGALLVLEKVLNDDKDGPLTTLIFDLGMLVAAGGRERSASEYEQLLKSHGFSAVQVKLLPESRFRDAILALKS